jgi:glycine C-acetyltransferase
MGRADFGKLLVEEVTRIDRAKVSKRRERVIEGFTKDRHPRAIIKGRPYLVVNSNDYLGLRHHPALLAAEAEASEQYGVGPGAVRFISGSMKVYADLEEAVAKFHGREAAMVFSSAFAANLAVLFSLIKGQSKDSAVGGETLVISDELNHRSIIDGIRAAGLAREQKAIFPHLEPEVVAKILADNRGKYRRGLIVTDGVFSMLGEFQDLKSLRAIADRFDEDYPEGVWLIVDDAHGIAASGVTGRGTEEVTATRADVLIGTLGKGFGVDGGYVAADQRVIDYLREAAATYIYSNPVAPGTAGAALAAVKLVAGREGRQLLKKLAEKVTFFKQELAGTGLQMAADSSHPIQPLLIGKPNEATRITGELFQEGIMVTSINYPVVQKGRDEIRIQLAASHGRAEIEELVEKLVKIHR